MWLDFAAQITSAFGQTTKKTPHSMACRTLPDTVLMRDLNVIEQSYVLECPSAEHDSVRVMFGFKAKLGLGGKPVRKSET